MFESELFGHVKGAFTDAKTDRVGRFELAEGGTLFLDEIANVPLNLQNKLLRVLETGEFERVGSSRTRKADVRILSATNADIAEEVRTGRFRQDLLYRLNTDRDPPPSPAGKARGHPACWPSISCGSTRCVTGRTLSGFDDAAVQILLEHNWPGNIRELDHTVERAVLMAQGTVDPPDRSRRGSRAGNLYPARGHESGRGGVLPY